MTQRGFFFTYGGVTLRFDPDSGAFDHELPKEHHRKALEVGMTDCWQLGELPDGWTKFAGDDNINRNALQAASALPSASTRRAARYFAE